LKKISNKIILTFNSLKIQVREKKTLENVNIVGTPKNYFKKLANCRTTNYK